MNVESRVSALNEKHSNLEQVISHELQRPNPDSVKLSKLKKEKLRLKEEIIEFVDKH